MSDMHDERRRRFLLEAARMGILGLLGLGGAALVARRGERCINNSVCRDCRVLADCGLPRALSVKRATKGTGHGGA